MMLAVDVQGKGTMTSVKRFYWAWEVSNYVQEIVMYQAAINCLLSVSMEEGWFIYSVTVIDYIIYYMIHAWGSRNV